MQPSEATPSQKMPEVPQTYPLVRLEKESIRIPQGVRRADRFDECLGPDCWSCELVRWNGMGDCEIRTERNLILTGFMGVFLFTDAEGNTVLAREDNHIVGLLPGTYRLRTFNSSEAMSMAYCLVFDDATAHLWGECKYFFKSFLESKGDPPRRMHFDTLSFCGDPYDKPPGVLGFRIVRLLGQFGMYFNNFFCDGPFRTYRLEGPEELHAADDEVPHLDWVEARRRAKYPELRKRLVREWARTPCFARPSKRDNFELPPGFKQRHPELTS